MAMITCLNIGRFLTLIADLRSLWPLGSKRFTICLSQKKFASFRFRVKVSLCTLLLRIKITLLELEIHSEKNHICLH